MGPGEGTWDEQQVPVSAEPFHQLSLPNFQNPFFFKTSEWLTRRNSISYSQLKTGNTLTDVRLA